MEVRPGAGLGFVQFHMYTMPRAGYAIIGLVPTGTSVNDHDYPGKESDFGSCGWNSSGRAYWTLCNPPPPHGAVKFLEGDYVLLVLDCRADPLVRLMVNNQPCLVHSLTAKPGTVLFPSVALFADSHFSKLGKACVVHAEPALLPSGWDILPS